MCVWDLLGGNRLLFRATSHQKTVTCLQVAAAAGADATPRLLSASLDGLVKVDLHVAALCQAGRPVLCFLQCILLAVGLRSDTQSTALVHAEAYMLAVCNRRRHARLCATCQAPAL